LTFCLAIKSIGDGVMTHYFSEDNNTLKSNPQVIAFSVNNTPLKFKTDNGVFSKNNLDRGTEVLLKYLEVDDSVKTCLDLGCGYGTIGVYINKRYDISVDMVDINQRAIDLSINNVELNSVEANVFKSDGFNNIKSKYDLIITNPPIRTGKELIYKFFEEAVSHLKENGSLILVINKKHGAESAIRFLNTIYPSVEILGRKKGFYVIRCKTN
jgi:16S rRNA (guanine1207-N2)-methyltransferase